MIRYIGSLEAYSPVDLSSPVQTATATSWDYSWGTDSPRVAEELYAAPSYAVLGDGVVGVQFTSSTWYNPYGYVAQAVVTGVQPTGAGTASAEVYCTWVGKDQDYNPLVVMRHLSVAAVYTPAPPPPEYEPPTVGYTTTAINTPDTDMWSFLWAELPGMEISDYAHAGVVLTAGSAPPAPFFWTQFKQATEVI